MMLVEEPMVEDRTNTAGRKRRVEDLNMRLLHKRRRNNCTKLKIEVIDYTKLKTSNLGYQSYGKGMVEEWSMEQSTTKLPSKPVVEDGSKTTRRTIKPKRRKLELRREQEPMDTSTGGGSKMDVGANTTTPWMKTTRTRPTTKRWWREHKTSRHPHSPANRRWS